MVVYLLLALACLIAGGYSALRLVADRFPNPVDLACISLVYYALPLSVAGYFYLNYGGYIFLNAYAGDQELAFSSMAYLFISLIGLFAGRVVAGMMGAPARLAFLPLSPATEERTQFVFVGLIGMIVLGVVLFGVVEFAAGYATISNRATSAVGNALVYWAVESMGLAMMVALLLRRYRPNPRLMALVVCSLILLAIIFVLRAKRLEVVVALLPVAVLLMSRRASIKLTVKKVFLGSLAVLALILISSIRVDTNLDVFYSVFYLFSEGLYAGHTLPGVIDRTSTGMLAYEYGARFVNGVIAFIPSFVWPGKEEMIYAGNLELQKLAPQGATHILAEVVLQGGFVAVALTFFVMGIIFQRLTYFEATWDAALKDGYMPFRFGLYLIAIAIFIPHFRDGIIPAMKLALQATVFLVILVGTQRVEKNWPGRNFVGVGRGGPANLGRYGA